MKAFSFVSVSLSLLFISAVSFGEGKAAPGKDAQATNTACASDAATAGCGDQKVGTGLMKCMWGYKKAHKDFKFSEGCRTAMKTQREDKKEHKAEKTK